MVETSEGFRKGQKHLLKGIQRRKPGSTIQQQSPLAARGPCLEVGNSGGALGEIEDIRREKILLMSEVMRLRQQQESTEQEITSLSKRLQFTEQKQQDMIAFLAKIMQDPPFMAQLMQNNEQAKGLDSTRKRRLPSVGSSNVQDVSAPTNEGLENGQLLECNNSHSNVCKELETLLQELEKNQFWSVAIEETIVAGQDGSETFMTQQYDDGEGKVMVKNVVKLEISDSVNGLSRTSSLGKQGDSSMAFWEQLLHLQNQMASTSAKQSMQSGEQKLSIGETVANTSGVVIESSDIWESKLYIDGTTKQLGHLGSSPQR